LDNSSSLSYFSLRVHARPLANAFVWGSMNNCRNSAMLAALAVSLAAFGAAVWTSGAVIVPALPLRAAVATVWLASIAGLVLLALRAAIRPLREASRMLESLSRLSAEDLASAQGCDWPRLPPENPLADALLRIEALLTEAQQQLSDAQHQRSALEVRARRHEAQVERMNAVLASLPEPVLVVDGYEELLLANTSARRLFKLEGQSIENGVLSQLVRCEKLIELVQETRRKKAAATRSDEVALPGPDGREHWYSITANPLAREANGPDAAGGGAVLVLRDISQQKMIQKRNAEFVSAVSHEMKTPLAGIKAYVEMLADGDAQDEQTQEEFLDVINSQADRLRRLIDNLLNLARIESGVVQVKKQPCSLNDLLQEAFQVVLPAAEQKQIALIADLSPMYLNVNVDRDQMLQAAINLLSNAVKYTKSGGKVTLRSRLDERLVQFDVEDTGVGLSPEDCQKVFEKFYRVHKDEQMAPGTGLGLPLARYIVEDVHGGRLTVQSTLGVGSTFTVSLPGRAKEE
jgi:two-component system phosphate regulon sensor histidine kinase PhoR